MLLTMLWKMVHSASFPLTYVTEFTKTKILQCPSVLAAVDNHVIHGHVAPIETDPDNIHCMNPCATQPGSQPSFVDPSSLALAFYYSMSQKHSRWNQGLHKKPLLLHSVMCSCSLVRWNAQMILINKTPQRERKAKTPQGPYPSFESNQM